MEFDKTISAEGARETVISGNRGQSSQSASTAFKDVLSNLTPIATAALQGRGGAAAVAISALTGAAGEASSMGGGTLMKGMSLGPPPAPPGGMGTTSSMAGATGGTDMAYGGQVDAMFNNNMQFLMLQTKVQNMSQQFQTITNVMKADFDARMASIRNIKQ